MKCALKTYFKIKLIIENKNYKIYRIILYGHLIRV